LLGVVALVRLERAVLAALGEDSVAVGVVAVVSLAMKARAIAHGAGSGGLLLGLGFVLGHCRHVVCRVVDEGFRLRAADLDQPVERVVQV